MTWRQCIVTQLLKLWKLNEDQAINKSYFILNVTHLVYIGNSTFCWQPGHPFAQLFYFFYFLYITVWCALFLSTWSWVPGRQRQRNGYVTALRCPGIYLIISLNEVGEAPKPLGLQTTLVCNWLTIYLWLLHGATCCSPKPGNNRDGKKQLCMTQFYNNVGLNNTSNI